MCGFFLMFVLDAAEQDACVVLLLREKDLRRSVKRRESGSQTVSRCVGKRVPQGRRSSRGHLIAESWEEEEVKDVAVDEEASPPARCPPWK